ncbi:hypothetical protein ACQRIT_006255 [Beauveria bassiana]
MDHGPLPYPQQSKSCPVASQESKYTQPIDPYILCAVHLLDGPFTKIRSGSRLWPWFKLLFSIFLTSPRKRNDAIYV